MAYFLSAQRAAANCRRLSLFRDEPYKSAEEMTRERKLSSIHFLFKRHLSHLMVDATARVYRHDKIYTNRFCHDDASVRFSMAFMPLRDHRRHIGLRAAHFDAKDDAARGARSSASPAPTRPAPSTPLIC